jgi:hypothetical protein
MLLKYVTMNIYTRAIVGHEIHVDFDSNVFNTIDLISAKLDLQDKLKDLKLNGRIYLLTKDMNNETGYAFVLTQSSNFAYCYFRMSGKSEENFFKSKILDYSQEELEELEKVLECKIDREKSVFCSCTIN